MNVWVSDQGSNFKNNVMQLLASENYASHRFTVAYSTWYNGTIEVINKHDKAACLALTTEMRLSPQDWPDILGIVENVLNEDPLPKLGFRSFGTFQCPLEVMTGIRPRRKLLIGIDPTTGDVERKALDMYIQTSFLKMHEYVAEIFSKVRAGQLRPKTKG